MATGAAAVQAPGNEAFGKRVALVIGNGAYGDLGALPNPPNDAADMAAALGKLGFEVIPVVDGDIDALHSALRRFGRSAVGAEVALFYYAGHGITLNGENYLVPVGANVEIEPDLAYEALSLDEVRRQLEFSEAPLKMVILDACRNNPLSRSLQRNSAELGRSLDTEEGLARMEVAPASGMLIAYATAPGSVALDGRDERNSPFTAALLDHIATPEIDARVMFGRVRSEVVEKTRAFQTPWVEDGMLGEFEFNPVAPEPEPAAPAADIVAWKEIADSRDPAKVEAFLATYPDTVLGSAARDRLALLRDPGTEPEAWKALEASTDPEAYEVFLRRYPNGAYADLAAFTLQQMLWQKLEAAGDLAGMEQFVARFSDGPYVGLARRAIETLRTGDTQVAAATVVAEPAAEPMADDTPLRQVTPQPVAQADPRETEPQLLQYALSALGFYDGTVDGQFGPASRRAVARYQESIGTPATGELTEVEAVSLVAAAAEAGDANSQVAYGLLFARGAGVEQDYVRAAQWFDRAADSGNGFGQMNLALLYSNGLGVAVDKVRARALLSQAELNGVPEAGALLQTMGD